MSHRVGAATKINLRNHDGDEDGFVLELRCLLDGTLIIRIMEPGQRAGIGLPGSIRLSELAGAFAKSVELRCFTQVGFYSFQRHHGLVAINYFRSEDGWLRRWNAPLAELLEALRDFGRRAA